MKTYLTKKDINEMREPLAWCQRTARRWSVPMTYSLISSRGRFYFGPADSTLAAKVQMLSLAIWGEDLTKGYTNRIGTPCVYLDLTKTAPKPRDAWDWETLAKI